MLVEIRWIKFSRVFGTSRDESLPVVVRDRPIPTVSGSFTESPKEPFSIPRAGPSCRRQPVHATLVGLAAEGTATLESDRSAAASPV